MAAEETLVSHFFYQIETRADDVAMVHRHPSGNGEWADISWRDYGLQAHKVARALIAQGVKPGQVVALYSENRPEWNITYMATLMIGACPFPIYTTQDREALKKLLIDADAVLLLVENKKLMERLRGQMGKLPHLGTIVIIEGAGDNKNLLSWPQLLQRGKAFPDTPLEQRLKELRQDNRALLLGPADSSAPMRLVQISHKNILAAGKALLEVIGPSNSPDRLFCQQPLAHISQQLYLLFMGMIQGSTLSFLTNEDLLLEDLRHVKPTILIASPARWQRIWHLAQSEGEGFSGVYHYCMNKAGSAIENRNTLEDQGQSLSLGHKLRAGLGNTLVLGSYKKMMGLEQCRYLASTGGPLSDYLEKQFLRLDLPLKGLFGFSECTGLATATPSGAYNISKVGPAAPTLDVRIEEDNTVSVSGPTIFMGYLNTWKHTSNVLKDGWVNVGDKGQLHGQVLQWIAHQDDVISTADGKEVLPYAMEHALDRIPEISRSIIVGDRQPYLIALLSLEEKKGMAWAYGRGANVVSLRELARNQSFNHYLQAQVDAINESLEPHQRIEKYVLLLKAFTVEDGDLTANMNLCRHSILDKHQLLIKKEYDEDWVGATEHPRRLHASN